MSILSSDVCYCLLNKDKCARTVKCKSIGQKLYDPVSYIVKPEIHLNSTYKSNSCLNKDIYLHLKHQTLNAVG